MNTEKRISIKRFAITSIMCVMTVFLMMKSHRVMANQESGNIATDNLKNVRIAPNIISVPIENILLFRKKADYCAIKFNKFWNDEEKEESYASYVSYYQNNGTGNLANNSVEIIKENLYKPKPRYFLWHPVWIGANFNIKCGPYLLFWYGRGRVSLRNTYECPAEKLYELAPTIWTDIEQVDVFDSRIKWYGYDEKRPIVYVPIDQLWDGNE